MGFTISRPRLTSQGFDRIHYVLTLNYYLGACSISNNAKSSARLVASRQFALLSE
jgi:hypothetical protein